jgi:K+-sensing histidine kinase KdpD
MGTPNNQPVDGSSGEGSQTEDSVDATGRFRIYLGAPPGVGKSYAS